MSHLERVSDGPAGATRSVAELVESLGPELQHEPVAPEIAVAGLARAVEGGLVGSAGPRYFGFVTGGALRAALAADWLASAWDQNSFSPVSSPAAAAVETVVAAWLLDLLGLPAHASVGLVTGAQAANVTGLAAARHAVLARVGWDVHADGLVGAPPVRVFAGAEAHVTVFRALRLLGLGERTAVLVEADDQGRMRADALTDALRGGAGPAIVCAQAGNVDTGALDPLADIAAAAREAGAWVHVDGAFGLWAAASPKLAHLAVGARDCHSWATDAHKWLNVPYDCGIVAVADPEAHAASMSMRAAYLALDPTGARANSDFVPEASRRARGFAVYAALRSLGRSGVADLVDRCCALARLMASEVAREPAIEVLNDVVLNQVLVRVAQSDAVTDETVRAVQSDGTCWVGSTRWHDRSAIRISISSWATTEEDVVRSAASIRTAAAAGVATERPSGQN